MATESDSISSQMQLSLNDLSMELKSLGLKNPVKNNCTSKADLCEWLLSTAWMLINLVHCSALGFNQNQSVADREALLLSEQQSLESKLSFLKSEVKTKDISLAKEQENVRRIEKELNLQSETVQKQKHMISMMTARLETQEKSFKHEIRKQEALNEYLREIIRKAGLGLRPHVSYAQKLSNTFGSMAVASGSSSEQADLHESSMNRVKAVNHKLVGENLMLRDALQVFHLDIYNILIMAQKVFATKLIPEPCNMSEIIFRLPLSYCMDAIKNLRKDQVCKLHEILQMKLTNKTD